jgi:hypothetical protein
MLLITIHKEDVAIRLLVKSKDVQGSKLTECFFLILGQIIILPHAFNTKHSLQLTNELKEVNISQNTTRTFFILPIYTSIYQFMNLINLKVEILLCFIFTRINIVVLTVSMSFYLLDP